MNSSTPSPKSVKRKFLLRALRILLLAGGGLYLVLLVVVAKSQRQMIYHPPVFSAALAENMGRSARLERWTNSTGEAIGWKRLSPRQPSRGRVLVTYGNASYAIGVSHYVDDIQLVAPFDVFILEYPGYGDREGSPTESSLFRAADEALSLLGTNAPVYVVGESLGTGVAAYLAGTYPRRIAGEALLSPYNRLAAVAQYQMPIFPVPLLLKDRFLSEEYLAHYHGPVAIMVDGLDVVVPARFGRRLYDGYAGPKRLWEYPYAGHITIDEPLINFWRAVVEFWQANPPAAG